MQPSELQQKWNLTNAQLAVALGKTEETVKAYKARKSARSHRNPPQSVLITCRLLDIQWQATGTPEIFFFTI
ncbi:hypothetical protein H6G36_25640 [Anabaena minutissima FACHB-250]|nr:hypothetical protein [Anabaena minutissima FACHB-250]